MNLSNLARLVAKAVLIIACLGSSSATFAQKIINNPTFSATNVPYLRVEKVIVSDTATVLYFKSEPGMSFLISSKSYLLENNGSDRLFLKGANGIVLDKFVIIGKEKTEFELSFPALKNSTASIDFIEDDCERCFKILDITPRPKKEKALLKQVFRGEWYKTDGSKEWVLGLFDSIAVYKNRVWKYDYTQKGRKATLRLRQNGQSKTLVAELQAKDGGLRLADENQAQVLLSKNKPAALLSQFDEEYPTTLLKSDSSVFRGFLAGYSPKLGFTTGQVSVNNNITGNQETYVITIAADGSFYAKFPMHYPQTVSVTIPGSYWSVYTEPGKETFLYQGLGTIRRPQFMGDCALINEELAATRFIFADNGRALDSIHGFSPAQYKKYILSDAEKRLSALESYRQNNFLSKKTASYIELEIKFRAAAVLFEYNEMIESAYRKAHNISNDIREPSTKRIVLDSAYFDYIRTLPVNSEVAFTTESYFIFAKNVSYSELVTNQSHTLSFTSLIAGLREDGTVFSAGDEAIIEQMTAWEKIILKDPGFVQKRKAELTKIISPFYERHQQEISAFIDQLNNRGTINKIKSLFGISDGLLTDVLYTQLKGPAMIRQFSPLSVVERQVAIQTIKHPVILKNLLQIDADITAKIAANAKKNVTSREVPDKTGDELFTSILERYKGKVVYVDFWATWCAPCMIGIQKIASLKEEMKNDDVVFLYITNPTSPEKTYKNVIPDIKGEHYRVNSDQWNYLCSKFKISGIPHYMLVDKSGTIVNDALPYLENSAIKAKILALK